MSINIRNILAPITVGELQPGWESQDFPFDALSVKPIKAATARALLPKSKDLHLWEWFGAKNRFDSRVWGEKMANYCAKFCATRFYINCEAEWSGSAEGFPFVAEPYANLMEAVLAFRAHAPAGTELAYNGFPWNRNSAGQKLHDADLIKTFDQWVPQIYSALYDKQSGFIAKTDKYKALTSVARVPMLYAGRFGTDGKFIGQDWRDQKALIGISGVREVAWYFGNGSKPRYNDLVAMVNELNGRVPTSASTDYTVVSGDSWWGIANNHYRDGSLFAALKKANNSPPMLHPGDVIRLPTKEELTLANS